ncbi:MAG: response regulator transcription factor [Dysgonamonadaceae bacterium]|jgi:DNA-binding NarL/FixJ family response regulator|nr:response regulator transcription factor [Dysgonamonadaceae bacterium]
MSALSKSRVVIIEPSPVIREGIKLLLEENAAFTVTGIYPDLQSFRNRKERKAFDIILIHPATIHYYRQFAVKEVFSDYADTIIVAIHYGYVDSETLADFDGILNLYDEGQVMRKKLERITKTLAGRGENRINNIDLSSREKEILVSVANGLTNKEIADKHFISVHTVVSHRKNITRKIGIKTISGLTIYAVLNNLIS